MKLQLNPGDLFASRSRSFVGWCIRAAQWVWSWDREAPYNHVGIITSSYGATLEARNRFWKYNLADYDGEQVLIVRHKEMTPERYAMGFNAVAPQIGQWYPFHRPLLFLIPPLAKINITGRGVCSEQTAKFMVGAGFGHVVYGITPDNLADLWRESKSMEIIFEGIMKKGLLQ